MKAKSLPLLLALSWPARLFADSITLTSAVDNGYEFGVGTTNPSNPRRFSRRLNFHDLARRAVVQLCAGIHLLRSQRGFGLAAGIMRHEFTEQCPQTTRIESHLL